MKKISRCINQQLTSLYAKAEKLLWLNQRVLNHLPSHLAPHCKVANFEQGTLTLVVNTQVFATEMRYRLPELRSNLRKNEKLYELITIKLIVNQNEVTANQKKECKKIQTKHEVCSNLRKEALSFDEDLGLAIEKLANSIEERLNNQ